MFDKSNQLKIIDFGLACSLESPKASKKCGTPGFIAPEVFTDDFSSQAIDLFSVGAIMFEMYASYQTRYQKRPLFSATTKDALLLSNQSFSIHEVDLPTIPDGGSDLLFQLL